MKHLWQTRLASLLFLPLCAQADQISLTLHQTQAKSSGSPLGYVVFKDTAYGTLITPHLHNIPPGFHGFHLHTKPSCADFGTQAGGHWDPAHSGRHAGPYVPRSHLGDLPRLFADKHGHIKHPVFAPRLKVASLHQHALILHAQGDNYQDTPKALGGGGTRLACGIIK